MSYKPSLPLSRTNHCLEVSSQLHRNLLLLKRLKRPEPDALDRVLALKTKHLGLCLSSPFADQISLGKFGLLLSLSLPLCEMG